MQLLRNRARCGPDELPLIVPFVGDAAGDDDAASSLNREASSLGRVLPVFQEDFGRHVGTALEVYKEEIDPSAQAFAAKRRMLILTRRGGQGKPQFVSPFTAGEGTTCGCWTKVVDYSKDGTPTKGFMKASVAVGFCPVECPFCYLQSYATEAIEIALNLGDLETELINDWRGFRRPINFGETGGLIEVDEWFAGQNGEGSLVQAVIDACAKARVTPFFLTKVRYPTYLRFSGRV
jgi:hypothetical protein